MAARRPPHEEQPRIGAETERSDTPVMQVSTSDDPTQTRELVDLLRRAATVTICCVIPALTLVTMFVIGLRDDSLAADFHHEIYPQAKEMLAGVDPYPAPDFDPTAAPNFIWPPLVAYLSSPLTLLPAGAADIVMAILGLACFGGCLWLLDVRDWRVYGALALWPQVAGEMRVSHLTPQLCLVLALAWRYRARRVAPGLLVGFAVALKFFVWPVIAYLAAIHKPRQAIVAAGVAMASLLLLVPFGLPDYVRALLQLGEAFDQDSYTLFGLLTQAGASAAFSRGATLLLGGLLLAGSWRYRSLALAIAASLTLSPIVWLDYFALAAVPLALARPRLSWIWFLPLATWGLEGAGIGIGDVGGTIRIMIVFAIVLLVAFLAEQRGSGALAPTNPGRLGHANPRAPVSRSGTT